MFIDNLRIRIEKLEAAVFGSEGATGEVPTVTISSPASATNGTLTVENMTTLQNVTAVIVFNKCTFRLYDNETASGYKVYAYAHNGKFDKITVTINTRAWVLVRG